MKVPPSTFCALGFTVFFTSINFNPLVSMDKEQGDITKRHRIISLIPRFIRHGISRKSLPIPGITTQDSTNREVTNNGSVPGNRPILDEVTFIHRSKKIYDGKEAVIYKARSKNGDKVQATRLQSLSGPKIFRGHLDQAQGPAKFLFEKDAKDAYSFLQKIYQKKHPTKNQHQ